MEHPSAGFKFFELEHHLTERDGNCIWHPFTQAKTAPSPIPIAGAKGAYLLGYDGSRYFDGISSWWLTLHGHCHPVIADRIAQQAHQLDQVIFADFTHSPGVELAERLIALLRLQRGRVFYSDNGSTAVETALKIALQYWHNLSPEKPRKKIVAFSQGYHGDTFGAMSASGATPFNRPFWPFLFEVHFVSPPFAGKEELSYTQLKSLVSEGDAACFIFEPLIQGVSGMQVHSAEGLDALIRLCHEYGVITIADEVMTGFGRTGPLFACDRFDWQPDITCLSKGLTGGFLPLGATVCKELIFQSFMSDNLQKAFLHGHSYCGNPLGCAAALASLDLLEDPLCDLQRRHINSQHRNFALSIAGSPDLVRCEVIGTILALEYKDKRNEGGAYFSDLRNRLVKFFIDRNILMRPLGNVLYLMPPYCTNATDLELVYKTIKETLESEIWLKSS